MPPAPRPHITSYGPRRIPASRRTAADYRSTAAREPRDRFGSRSVSAEALRVRTQDPQLAAAAAELLDRLAGRPAGVADHVEVERVLPRVPAQGPRLELAEVEVALGEETERAVERAGLVVEHEHDRGLGCRLERAGFAREQQEARVVLGVILPPSERHVPAVEPG